MDARAVVGQQARISGDAGPGLKVAGFSKLSEAQDPLNATQSRPLTLMKNFKTTGSKYQIDIKKTFEVLKEITYIPNSI